jgi:hypothetical protein
MRGWKAAGGKSKDLEKNTQSASEYLYCSKLSTTILV